MPDKKISELTAATSIDGTEEIPFAKAGANGKATAELLTSRDKARAHLSVAFTTATTGAQKVPLDTASIDTNGLWDNVTKRLTPKKAGYYRVYGILRFGSGGNAEVVLYKNGAQITRGQYVVSGYSFTVDDLIYFNGTTDYIEMFVVTTVARAVSATSSETFMTVVGPM